MAAKKLSRQGKLMVVLSGLIAVVLILGVMLLVRSCGEQPAENKGETDANVEFSYDSTLTATTEVIDEMEAQEEGSKDATRAQVATSGKKWNNYLEELIFKESHDFLYGLSLEGMRVESGEIESGETLSRLLNDRYNVDIGVVNKLVVKSDGVFDLREMRVGNGYKAIIRDSPEVADSVVTEGTLKYLVYAKTNTEYVIFDTEGETSVTIHKREVVTREKYSEGVINSSLYATIYEEGLSPQLAARLSEIYKWTIDFFAIQKGDSFRVIYEEQYIDTVRIGIGKIYGAEFVHMDKPYLAIRFTQGEETGYWDGEGKNLRKNFLQAPLSFSARVSSKYGMRTHPIRRTRQMHNGVDYAAPTGTPVLAIADGTVTRAGWDGGGGGNRIWLRHARGLESAYLHLSRFAKGIRSGVRVKQGQVIGYVGSTGMSTGPHLDFRIRQNGKYINPQKVPSVPTTPIKDANKASFERMMSDVMGVMGEYQQ